MCCLKFDLLIYYFIALVLAFILAAGFRIRSNADMQNMMMWKIEICSLPVNNFWDIREADPHANEKAFGLLGFGWISME